jgi:hypothetical protein
LIQLEHRESFARSGDFPSHTLEDLERNGRIAWGAPEEVRDILIALAEALRAGMLTLHFDKGLRLWRRPNGPDRDQALALYG